MQRSLKEDMDKVLNLWKNQGMYQAVGSDVIHKAFWFLPQAEICCRIVHLDSVTALTMTRKSKADV